MKKSKYIRAIFYPGIVIVMLILGTIGFIRFRLPDVALEKIHFERTPARVERGQYLFNAVAGCVDCHSVRENQKFAMPVKADSIGAGGESFDERKGFPGHFIAKNLTPYHLGSWSDAEIFRAITSGVDKNGQPLFPVMPYLDFGKADREDIYSIIAYIRTLNSISTDQAESGSAFPMNFIVRTMPREASFGKIPSASDTIRYGDYLVNMAGCKTCHSQAERGKLIAGFEFGGGRVFGLAGGAAVRSANITPDKLSGIGTWTVKAFIQRFRSYDIRDSTSPFITPGSFNTVMPWTSYSKMKTQDLVAIFRYLQQLPAVYNRVKRFQSSSR